MFKIVDFLIYCFLCAYTPGANNILSMSNSARLGFKKSVSFNFGITVGFAIVMTACSLFTTTLYSLIPKIEIVIEIIGAIYMLWLAWKIFRSGDNISSDDNNKIGFLSGMLLQFMNPKIYVYSITAMSIYVLPVYNTVPWIIFFTFVLTVIGSSGSYVWALCGSVFCKIISKYSKIVNTIMALLLVYCAVSLFF
ncbi:MAG: LysE family transporter [Clostridia bacterium]|nr:LysE family transporter [Clostridia bacterium]